MKLADKPCYPETYIDHNPIGLAIVTKVPGLTFRERLIIAGFGNPKVYDPSGRTKVEYSAVEQHLLMCVDAIIKEIEK